MTEVDAVMPEGIPLQTPAQILPESRGSNNAVSATNTDQQLKTDQKNDINKENNSIPGPNEAVDAVASKEDSSPIISSTENGSGDGNGDVSNISEDTPKRSLPVLAELSKQCGESEATPQQVDDEKLKEKSSSATDIQITKNCESIEQCGDDNGENTASATKSADANAVKTDTVSSTKLDADSFVKPSATDKVGLLSDTQDQLSPAADESNTQSPKKKRSSDANLPNADNDETLKDAKTTNCSDHLANPLGDHIAANKDTAEVPLPIEEASVLQKENGVASDSEKVRNESNIVDLGDDTDEDVDAVGKKGKQKANTTISRDPIKAVPLLMESPSKRKSICSDSDGAVVIGSDSENEMGAQASKSHSGSGQMLNSQLIDDDDDDCVVIEDDAPMAAPADLTKRKSTVLDSANNSDDSQPPSKRQCGGQATPNQISVRDARCLMPQEGPPKKPNEGTIYPINITSAPPVLQGPPKLVPVSNAAIMPLSGLPNMNCNTNLLPGLTDDMYVLEAPSFIVPYIYEKPPVNNLKEIVRDIESKYKFTKEDLAEADKSDEFDMMTEQNKEEKDEKDEKDEKNGDKKKKKRRGVDDGDESWSEESDEDDDDEDDDDSESGMRTKVLIKEASDDLTAFKSAIKPAAIVAQPPPVAATAAEIKPGQENYFESPLGKFFMDIGVGLVQEFVQSDLIRLQKRKMRKSLGKNITDFERAISALSGNLDASKKKNSAFKFTMKRCEFCNFKSESALAMANHYETPHMNGPLYKCNFCTFEIRNATEIVYHMEAMHNIKARLIKPLPYHQCPNCGFEDNGKAKLARHQPVCAKKFRPELNLTPPNDWEAPAKIPRIKPRHGLVGTATAYQAMAAQAAAQKAALASIQQQQQQVAQARSLQAAAIAAQNANNKIRGRPPTIMTKQGQNSGVMRGPSQVRNPMATNVVLPNNYQLGGGHLTPQQTANAMAKKTLSGQPSISITPLPRQSATPQPPAPSTSKMPQAGVKPGQNVIGNKAQFVICEICDGYIKDLEQLRNHMQWMHKVKIHPKMIYNRPPLNCQKCQFRFFTDQGLERHLLGSHGLVTSSMQEAANKGKDAGRCPVCGRMYQWKLLNHVSRDHHMTLKPAHLSYKCTVCTATFGMYKQFETHVYTAHSNVAKKAMDSKKNNSVATGSATGGGTSINHNQRSSLGATSDSLLKPLKINDEITIIPQPASKPRITNLESHVID